MAKRIAVVVSQSQSQNPAKRDLEEEIVAALLMENGIDVTIIPHLYDLTADSTGMVALQGVRGPLVVLSWMFPRAAHWVLDRNGIDGKEGQSLLATGDDDEEDELEDQLEDEDDGKLRVIDDRNLANRFIYCLDLRGDNNPQTFINEVKRIANEQSTEVVDLMGWVGGSPSPQQQERFLQPANDTHVGAAPAQPDGSGVNGTSPGGNGSAAEAAAPVDENGVRQPVRIEDKTPRRWYPVIDFARCTNCMECIDFCLFGVYGVDDAETILVEQPDNCRKGCPACSRVCPENAIIFPQHKTPAIAGSPEVAGGLKIDLSQLFGAPAPDEDAADVAVRERDEQLLLAGRDAVGASVGMPRRQAEEAGPNDELDDLLDELDDLDI